MTGEMVRHHISGSVSNRKMFELCKALTDSGFTVESSPNSIEGVWDLGTTRVGWSLITNVPKPLMELLIRAIS